MDKVKVQSIRTKLNKLFEEHIANEFPNLQLKVGNASYGGTNVTFKLEVAEKDESGAVISKERADFELYAEMYDLAKTDFGKPFTHGGKTYTIAGLKPRSRKYPILGTDSAGTTYKFEARAVKAGLI